MKITEGNAKAVFHDWLIQAEQRGADDLAIRADQPPRVKINSSWEQIDIPKLSADDARQVIMSFIPESRISTYLSHKQVDFSYSLEGVGRYRVNLFHSMNSPAAVLRLIPTSLPDWQQLGLPDEVKNLYKLRQGIVLVTGATGSGKSTTLAALIHLANTHTKKHIITIEDPIEFYHPQDLQCIINQREVGEDCLSFADGLKASLRQAPNIILVGEIRDAEAAETAIQAASTGHLVLGTLHTSSTKETIGRLVDYFPPERHSEIKSKFAGAVQGVLCQQLLPTTDGKRVLAYEILLPTGAVRAKIRAGREADLINDLNSGNATGMISMDTCLVNLYKKGAISKETLMNSALDAKRLEKDLNR